MKGFITLLVALALVQATAFSQPCLPGGIEFHTQNQVDSFQINYPGCNEIEGYVAINGLDINNLNGLNVLSSIAGNLMIFETSLNSLEGLDNLVSVGGYLIIGYDDGYQVFPNLSLQSLSGLENLITIGEGLEIYHNYALISLSGLNNLTYIENNLSIWYNDVLTSLEGLDNINSGTITDLYIHNNYLLSTCDVQSICDYLSAPNGTVEIHDNATGCNSQEEVEADCANSCLPEGITFATQAQIDSFSINYPNCTEIEGNVIIQGDDITNLNGFSIVTRFSGSLQIGIGALAIGNPSLKNLSGLENVTYIGGDLEIFYNDSLSSIVALESLDFIGGALGIGRSPQLTSLEGLNSIDTVAGLNLDWLESLEDLSGLGNLKFVDGSLTITMCNQLRNLSELNNLISINGDLGIYSNWLLNSLTGLDNIIESSILNLSIISNDSLSTCEIISICEYLASPNGNVWISDNDIGCNSQEEVIAACEVGIEENVLADAYTLFPNPFASETTFSISLEEPAKVNLLVMDSYGRVVATVLNESMGNGDHHITWNAEGLPSGIYFYRLTTGSQLSTGKLLVIK